MENTNFQSINFSSYFECVIQEDSHIRQREFKVTIPSLFPQVDNKTEPTQNKKPIDQNRSINGGHKVNNSNISTTTIINAKNHTDYYYKLRGDIFKETMDGTDGVTETFGVEENKYTDIKQHDHDIKEPMSLFNFTYENLNNIMVPKGTLAYGFFINGTFDTTSFAIVRIEGAVPYANDDIIDYQK